MRRFIAMIRGLVASLIDAIVAALTHATSVVQTERITNGGFASGASWTIVDSAWTISSGTAQASGASGGNGLNQTFTAISAGAEIAVALDVVSNDSASLFYVILTSSGTPTQTVYGGIPVNGERISVSTTASATFDGIRFEVDAAGSSLVIDNASLKA